MCSGFINFKCKSSATITFVGATQDGISTSAAMCFNSEIVSLFDSKGLYLPLLTSSASFLGHPNGLPLGGSMVDEVFKCSVFRTVELLQLGGIHGAISVALTGSGVADLKTACCFHYFAVHIPPPLFNIHNPLCSIHFAGNWPHHLRGKRYHVNTTTCLSM